MGEFSLDTRGCWAINMRHFLYWRPRWPRRRHVAQGESACLTRKRSVVRDHPCLPSNSRKTEAPEEQPSGASDFQGALGKHLGYFSSETRAKKGDALMENKEGGGAEDEPQEVPTQRVWE